MVRLVIEVSEAEADAFKNKAKLAGKTYRKFIVEGLLNDMNPPAIRELYIKGHGFKRISKELGLSLSLVKVEIKRLITQEPSIEFEHDKNLTPEQFELKKQGGLSRWRNADN